MDQLKLDTTVGIESGVGVGLGATSIVVRTLEVTAGCISGVVHPNTTSARQRYKVVMKYTDGSILILYGWIIYVRIIAI